MRPSSRIWNWGREPRAVFIVIRVRVALDSVASRWYKGGYSNKGTRTVILIGPGVCKYHRTIIRIVIIQ